MNALQHLSRLKIEYENNKAKFDKWVKENNEMSGTPDYDDYVQKFRAWEKQILDQIEQLQDSITRRPVEQVPQLPTQDLDEQLYAVLREIPMAKFTSALVQLCKQDHSVFSILTEVVERETKDTGYQNTLLPSVSTSGYGAIPPSFPSMIQLPNMNQAPPLIPTSYIPYNAAAASTSMNAVPPPQAYTTTPYTQSTPYGLIPADWTIDEPVKRQKRQSPPLRMISIKQPFKDFTQS